MKRVKTLLDPEGILNPGVLINDDPHCHTKNLKNPMASHALIDNCVECGFCEAVCPSQHIGLTPRQRVALWRHICRMKHENHEDTKDWLKVYDQLGTDLCATDGLCTTKCPLRVDVASFVRDRRNQTGTDFAKNIAHRIGNNFSLTTRSASHLLDGVALFQRLLGDALMYKSATVAKKVVGKGLPSWNEHMPRGGKRLANIPGKTGETIIYMPSCAIRTMGDSVHDPAEPLATVTIRVLERAGYNVVYPENINTLCCGKAFDTKGLFDEARLKASEMEAALLKASDNGKFPIFCETSPCLAHMRKVLDQRLKMYEPIEFATKYLAHRLTFTKVKHRVAIHPTCSTRLLGLAESFVTLAEQCAEDIVWPEEIQCCGFSGDKGFSHPELNKSALENLAEKIQGCEMGYSTSRTCEIGLSLHGKVPYRNIMYLLDLCTTGK
jgi:D-lactate dehydrogenase